MTMQWRHFELIAKIITELPDDYRPASIVFDHMQRDIVAKAFSRSLRTTNPNFNEARFLKACGVEQ